MWNLEKQSIFCMRDGDVISVYFRIARGGQSADFLSTTLSRPSSLILFTVAQFLICLNNTKNLPKTSSSYRTMFPPDWSLWKFAVVRNTYCFSISLSGLSRSSLPLILPGWIQYSVHNTALSIDRLGPVLSPFWLIKSCRVQGGDVHDNTEHSS